MRQLVGQRGGTFVGLVFGLVLGLGIALGVAVYVTKVPVPFLNKGQSRSSDQDAAEAKKNKDWDPNVLIQGKNPVRASSGAVSPAPAVTEPAMGEAAVVKAKPAAEPVADKADAKTDSVADAKAAAKAEAKALAKAAAKAEAAKLDGKTDEKPDTKAEAKAEVKPEVKKPAASADPLGDLVATKSSSTAADPFTYMVQTGAFRSEDEANAQRAKLALMGVDVKVTEREQAGRTVYRVRAGPFERKTDAESSKDRLGASGIETVLVRVQR